MGFFKKLKERFSGEGKKEAKEPDVTEEDTSTPEEDAVPAEVTHPESDPATTEQPETEKGEPEPPVVEQPEPEEPELEHPAAMPPDVEQPETEQPEEQAEKQGKLKPEKYKNGLSKTRNAFAKKINDLVARYRTVDEDFFEDLEEVLISADVGFDTVMDLVDELKMEVKRRNIKDTRKVREVISEKLVEIYYGDDEEEIKALNTEADGLSVILFVGVNGVGKTTTIGKMAHKLQEEGKSVMLAAGDTFRAGAIEQLEVWGERAGVEVVKHSEGSDPAAVIYDGIRAAQSRKVDVLLCDTAGRLQNKVNLMNELSKVKRVIEREIPGAPHEVLLVLDATTGQNAMNQAKTFSEATDVSGIVLTKLDGTAKGGIVLAIRRETDIPVKFVGLGEKVTDLQVFDAHAFVYGLFADMLDEEE